MIKIVLASLLLTSVAHAYVPTVESLFRHGSNPDVTGNGISLTMVVKKMGEEKTPVTTQDASLV